MDIASIYFQTSKAGYTCRWVGSHDATAAISANLLRHLGVDDPQPGKTLDLHGVPIRFVQESVASSLWYVAYDGE